MDPINDHASEIENESVENVIDRNVDVESTNPIHFEHQIMESQSHVSGIGFNVIEENHTNQDHVDPQETQHSDSYTQDTRNNFAYNIDGTVYFFPNGHPPYPIAQNIYNEVQY
jgi:hypothetical protein